MSFKSKVGNFFINWIFKGTLYMLSEFCQFLSNFSPFLFVLVLNSRKFFAPSGIFISFY